MFKWSWHLIGARHLIEKIRYSNHKWNMFHCEICSHQGGLSNNSEFHHLNKWWVLDMLGSGTLLASWSKRVYSEHDLKLHVPHEAVSMMLRINMSNISFDSREEVGTWKAWQVSLNHRMNSTKVCSIFFATSYKLIIIKILCIFTKPYIKL